MKTLRSRYIGNRNFYRTVLAVAVPIMIQNAISNFVGMMDNIMVGQVGTAQMNGVSIVNQLYFVFNLCIFGAVSGAGIFTAQFAGSKDHEGIRHTFRFKLLICLALTLLCGGLLYFARGSLIGLYLKGEHGSQYAQETMVYGLDYLKVMLWGLLPFAVANAYCSTLRENGETLLPMAAGIAAVLTNLALNYVLIFGHFGAPKLGVHGAAIATVASRYVECLVAMAWTHLHPKKQPFIVGAYKSLHVPGKLVAHIVRKGTPLLVNETMFAVGIAMLTQAYSLRGLDVIAAQNIANTIWNVFSVSFMALGSAVGIMVGQKLGSGASEEEVRDTDRKLIVFSVSTCILFSIGLALLAKSFPHIYNTTDEVRTLASHFIWIGALFMPFCAYTNAAYFTLRSGGKTFVTFLFDSCFVCGLVAPLAWVLSAHTTLPIVPLFFICQATEVLKCLIGWYMIRRGDWIQNIVVSD